MPSDDGDMAQTDSEVLEDLKTARDAVLAAIAEGRMTVMYRIGNREHETLDPIKALDGLEKLIERYETKSNQDSTSARNLAKLTRRP